MNTPREHLCEGGILTKEYIAVVGSRHGVKPKAVKKFIDRFNPLTTAFVSGGAVGVDSEAAKHARYKGFEVIEILPDYEKFGRVAPLKRNTDIVKRSDSVAAFWNGKSTGTLDTVKKALKLNRPTALFTADGELMQFTPSMLPERMDVCLVAPDELAWAEYVEKSPHSTPQQKREATRFYDEALSNAHLAPCSFP